MKRIATIVCIGMIVGSLCAHTEQGHANQDCIVLDTWIENTIAIGHSCQDSPVMFVNLGDGEWIQVAGPTIIGGGGSIAEQCIASATAVCGKGNICSMKVTVSAEGDSCEFTCRDANGNCPGTGGTPGT